MTDKQDIGQIFGEVLRRYRSGRNVSQEERAHQAGILRVKAGQASCLPRAAVGDAAHGVPPPVPPSPLVGEDAPQGRERGWQPQVASMLPKPERCNQPQHRRLAASPPHPALRATLSHRGCRRGRRPRRPAARPSLSPCGRGCPAGAERGWQAGCLPYIYRWDFRDFLFGLGGGALGSREGCCSVMA
jgi:hypothetical protein